MIRIHNCAFWMGLAVFGSLAAQDGSDGVLVDQRTQWVAVITDTALIREFIDAFYIAEESVTRIEILDINNNGFSKGDLIRTYPNEEIYFLDDPGDRIQRLMDAWRFQANYNVTLENTQTPEVLEASPYQKAEYAIVASFLRGLNRNYQDLPLKIWVQRDEKAMTFQMWGYNLGKLIYQPSPPSGYDVLTLTKTVRDSILVPVRK